MLGGEDDADEATIEVERWCRFAAEGEGEPAELAAALTAEVIAFCRAAVRDGDTRAHLPLLTLVAELWGDNVPPARTSPEARLQRAVLEAALSDALRTQATVSMLIDACWDEVLRADSTRNAAAVRMHLAAVVSLRLRACDERPSGFWLAHYPSLVEPLRAIVRDKGASVHARKNVAVAVTVLHEQLADAFESLPEPHVQPLVNALRALASQDASPAVRQQALAALVRLQAARSEHPSESLLQLLRSRASDKSQQVRAGFSTSPSPGLSPGPSTGPSTGPSPDLIPGPHTGPSPGSSPRPSTGHRGIFEQDAPAVKRACKSFVGHALRSRAESPVDLLVRTGMARALMDLRGQGGGSIGRVLYNTLFEDQDLARAAFDAMKMQPPAHVRELQMRLAGFDDRDGDSD
ncbi:hypothetical protein T492DRAFT_1114524 [Pavlovales sp. CCMP2436]|nr:hypothetical protein T492DRAFT_1114524 [Pavlovales sp. CCMP2436]